MMGASTGLSHLNSLRCAAGFNFFDRFCPPGRVWMDPAGREVLISGPETPNGSFPSSFVQDFLAMKAWPAIGGNG